MGIVKSIAAMSLVICATAHAEFKDGNKLLSDMNNNHSTQMNAIGYVTGVADTLSGVTFCAPPSITAGQIYDMTKQYLEQNPANRHNSADRIIGLILRVTWPCSRGQAL